MSEEPIVKPVMSPKRDIERLGKNGQAVVGELREFLANLKGKSPKEMMGAVAESHLGKSLVSATVFMAVLLFILSVVPFYLKQNQEAEKLARDEAPSSGASSSEQEKESEYVPEVGEAGEKPLTTPEQSTADALGIGEQKVADPKSNPLDSSGEDLLDGLDDI